MNNGGRGKLSGVGATYQTRLLMRGAGTLTRSRGASHPAGDDATNYTSSTITKASGLDEER